MNVVKPHLKRNIDSIKNYMNDDMNVVRDVVAASLNGVTDLWFLSM